MEKLSGTQISKVLKEKLKKEVELLKTKNIHPTLAVILAGDDPASAVYVNSKKKNCEIIGIKSIEEKLPQNTSQEEVLKVINKFNEDKQINGILCQFPLPPQCDEIEATNAISPQKDVDGTHPMSIGLLASGTPQYISCTPYGVLQILKQSNIETSGKHVVILGRSKLVGRPLSILLSLKGWDATVTVCHSRTKNIAEVCKQADILIAAIGRPHFVTADFVKPGAVVIDVGINKIDDPNHPKGSYLVGDVDYTALEGIAKAATPVPGGVGPMTITMLMYNTINAARLQAGLPKFEFA